MPFFPIRSTNGLTPISVADTRVRRNVLPLKLEIQASSRVDGEKRRTRVLANQIYKGSP